MSFALSSALIWAAMHFGIHWATKGSICCSLQNGIVSCWMWHNGPINAAPPAPRRHPWIGQDVAPKLRRNSCHFYLLCLEFLVDLRSGRSCRLSWQLEHVGKQKQRSSQSDKSPGNEIQMRSAAGGALVKFLGEAMQPKVFNQVLNTWTCQAEQQAVSLACFLNFIMSLAVFGFCMLLGSGPPCLFLLLKACFGPDFNSFMSDCHAKLLHCTAYFNINMTFGGWSKI